MEALDGPSSEAEFGGFETSPFKSAIVTIKLADSARLTIHRSILRQSAELAFLLDTFTYTVDLQRFSATAGHALIRFLYAGIYDAPKWTGFPQGTESVALCELKAKLEIYALARTLELDILEGLVRDDIERTAADVDMFTIIDAVRAEYPTPVGNDKWFPRWIKTVAKLALLGPRTLQVGKPKSHDFSDDAAVMKLLFGCMMEAFSERLAALAGTDGLADGHAAVGDGSRPSSSTSGGNGDTPPSTTSLGDGSDGNEAAVETLRASDEARPVSPAWEDDVELVPEPQPVVEPVVEPEPVPESQPVVEHVVEPEPVPAEAPEDLFFASKAYKKNKKKKARKAETPLPEVTLNEAAFA